MSGLRKYCQLSQCWTTAWSCKIDSRHAESGRLFLNFYRSWPGIQRSSKNARTNMGMGQYLLIPFLGEWTSIYQLFWCSPGVQGFDTLPYKWYSKTDKVGVYSLYIINICWIGEHGMTWISWLAILFAFRAWWVTKHSSPSSIFRG